ncbi:molybdopterin-dependent oxidoreductase [Adlercreutzia sp. R25]|uniref:molybdopterin-dependent oxidoreductase n=1 Tax=Adlercreutzia shanghongiae TaxID=3111773 RepID=UPI002DBC9082|nr:molybdopterin-dependent oxidoreductase [Adlercreutzia sp. R25]MEC4271861.1 molybdopterin-dependent oxidoreductase [Adlercreutzia sp. R25]
MSKTADKTVYMTTGLLGFGEGSNTAAIDLLDGEIVRVRPLDLTDKYAEEDLHTWKLEVRGHSIDPGTKTTLPPHALGYKKRAYSKNRVPYPLKRVDFDPEGERNPQNRGISGYERISWDEATDIIAKEIQRCIDEYGPSSVFIQGDGHGESKLLGGGHGCSTRLMDLLGGYTVQSRQPDSWEGWYWGAKHMWGMDPIGQQSLQQNLFRDISENCELALFWGCDPETTPWGWGGQTPSRICYFWSEIGIKSVYICPDLNYAAAVHADKWIPVLPNTDAALQLAIAYTWLKEGTYDQEYLDSHAVGFENFSYYVLGGEDGVPKTPKWAEQKCGVPSRQIKALARYWAKKRTSIIHCNGGGFIRSVFAHEPARLEVALLAMQGVGKPGRNMFKLIEWGLFGMNTLNPMPRSEWGTYLGKAFTGHVQGSGLRWFVPQTLVPDAITLPEGEKLSWYGHVLCALPREDQFNKFEYPAADASRIHMFWTDSPCWSTCWNGGNRMQDALRDSSIEFMLAQHQWMENDTLFADIILPISTKLEQDDISKSSQGGINDIVVNEEQAIAPVGESKSDIEAVLAIAAKLGLEEKLMETLCYAEDEDYRQDDGRTGDEKMAFDDPHPFGEPSLQTLKKIAYSVGGLDHRLDYDEFLEKGYLPIPFADDWYDDPIGMTSFVEDPEGNPLTTPTGKIEFYATGIADHWPGDEERPPVPHWIEESEAHHERLTNERGKDYPFLLVSNHPRFRVHAQLDDVSWLREIDMCKIEGPDGYLYEPVWMNPLDARARGLKDGDIVSLYNERGRVLGALKVTERIMPGALSQDHGARVDAIVTGTGGLDRGGANNLICPGATTSKNAPGEVTNGFLVNIEKVDVLELAKQYPDQFNRDYDPAEGLVASARIVKE